MQEVFQKLEKDQANIFQVQFIEMQLIFDYRDTYQRFWYTGVILVTKLDHYFTVMVSVNPFLGF